MEDFLDTKEMATLLKVSKRTLESWRMLDEGPNYIKLGNSVRYRKSDIEMWIDANHHTTKEKK